MYRNMWASMEIHKTQRCIEIYKKYKIRKYIHIETYRNIQKHIETYEIYIETYRHFYKYIEHKEQDGTIQKIAACTTTYENKTTYENIQTYIETHGKYRNM